ncbi:MAG: DUF86 domain-containing protein [Wenzhouxiangellaceae bacterium]
MDEAIIVEKLESLRRCVRRIEEKRPASVEELKANPDLQDILSLNLTRAVQVAVDIATHVLSASDESAPETMGQAFGQLAAANIIPNALAARMISAVGFRNVAVLSYRSINWDIVHAISHDQRDDFRSFAEHVIDFLK